MKNLFLRSIFLALFFVFESGIDTLMVEGKSMNKGISIIMTKPYSQNSKNNS